MTSATDSAVDSDVIALAGIYQAVNLVKQVAHEGRSNLPAFRASIGSVFRFDADSAESVYGGVAGVKHGLDTLIGQLGGG
jgi:high frequency lysogenization protein